MFSWQSQHRRSSDAASRTIANWSLWQRMQLLWTTGTAGADSSSTCGSFRSVKTYECFIPSRAL